MDDIALKIKWEQAFRQADVVALVILGATLLFAYITALTIPFGMSDDYYYLAEFVKTGDLSEILSLGPLQGRIIQGIILHIFFRPSNITDFMVYRLVILTGFLLLGVLFYFILRRYEGVTAALLVSISCLCLLPFQAWLAWAMLFLVPYAAFLGSLAMIITLSGIACKRIAMKFLIWSAAVLIFWVALNIYQPAAMFFWVIGAIVLLYKNPGLKALCKHTLIIAGVGFSGILLSYLTMILAQRMTGIFDSRTDLAYDVFGKLYWFAIEPLFSALNFWLLQPSAWAAVLTGIVIVLGLFIYLKGSPGGKLASLAVFAFYIFLAYLPNLVIAENWGSYRTQAAVTVLLFLYLFIAIKTIVQRLMESTGLRPRQKTAVLTWVGGLFTLTLVLLAQYRFLHYFALPGYLEQRFVKSELARGMRDNLQGIVIIRSDWQDSLTGLVRFDEFGMPASYSEDGAIPQLISVLYEYDPQRVDIPVREYAHDESPPVSPDELLIDMRKIRDLGN